MKGEGRQAATAVCGVAKRVCTRVTVSRIAKSRTRFITNLARFLGITQSEVSPDLSLCNTDTLVHCTDDFPKSSS